jgi:hypothetical protein
VHFFAVLGQRRPKRQWYNQESDKSARFRSSIWRAPQLYKQGAVLSESTKMAVFWVVAHLDWYEFNSASIDRVMSHLPDNGGSKNFWNVGNIVPVYLAPEPRRNLRGTTMQKRFIFRWGTGDLKGILPPMSLLPSVSTDSVIGSFYWDNINLYVP